MEEAINALGSSFSIVPEFPDHISGVMLFVAWFPQKNTVFNNEPLLGA
jgi:hypothetical protein